MIHKQIKTLSKCIKIRINNKIHNNNNNNNNKKKKNKINLNKKIKNSRIYKFNQIFRRLFNQKKLKKKLLINERNQQQPQQKNYKNLGC